MSKVKKLKARVEELTEQLAAMQKANEDNKTWRENYQQWYHREQQKVADIEAVLDTVPEAPGKFQVVPDGYGATNRVELTPQARLAGMLSGLVHRQFRPRKTTTIKEEDS